MKNKFINIPLLLILFSSSVSASKPSAWEGELKPSISHNWKIGIQYGYMSYFGDLSLYDTDPLQKFQLETGSAGSIIITKQMGKLYQLSGQFIYGGFSSDVIFNRSFTTEIFEYNLQGRLDVLKMFYKTHNPKTGLFVIAGIGQFLHNSITREIKDGAMIAQSTNSYVPEFVFFSGGGINYRINDLLSVSAELSIRQAQNDNLDNLVKNGNPDYYSLFMIGISWSMNNIMNPLNLEKKKAHRDLGLSRRR